MASSVTFSSVLAVTFMCTAMPALSSQVAIDDKVSFTMDPNGVATSTDTQKQRRPIMRHDADPLGKFVSTIRTHEEVVTHGSGLESMFHDIQNQRNARNGTSNVDDRCEFRKCAVSDNTPSYSDGCATAQVRCECECWLGDAEPKTQKVDPEYPCCEMVDIPNDDSGSDMCKPTCRP
mmetsp:Transcript_77091/g.121746  ORF Transcript_77091/g.121746 Transcript_77091/m.121746 type:complete len:177 (+) Transcript_77091:54-584(+)